MSSRGLLILVEQGLQGSVLGGVVCGVVLPAGPDDVDPRAGQDAHGVGVIVSAGAGAAVEIGGPWIAAARSISEVAHGVTQLFVAGPPKPDRAHLARLTRRGCHASQAG